MSIFKSKWIILKINKNIWASQDTKSNAWEFLYTIFTKDYGTILCSKKRSKSEKPLDLWYTINFEIITKEHASIHKIKNIKISSQFVPENTSFWILHGYLWILQKVLTKFPAWVPNYELFELLELLNTQTSIDTHTLLLFECKIVAMSWELQEENSDQTIQKILKFVHNNKISTIIKLTGITDEIEKKLRLVL